jgi:hypothetical protein
VDWKQHITAAVSFFIFHSPKENVSVASVFRTIPLNISFRRGLVGNNLALWNRLVGRVADVRLTEVPDRFMGGFHQNGVFFVKSMYTALITDTRVVQVPCCGS